MKFKSCLLQYVVVLFLDVLLYMGIVMDLREVFYRDMYRISDEEYLETVHSRNDINKDVWLCSFGSRKKRFITSIPRDEADWMDKVKEMLRFL